MVRVVGLGLIQNEHGVWCVRRKVPKRLEEAVARVAEIYETSYARVMAKRASSLSAEHTESAVSVTAERQPRAYSRRVRFWLVRVEYHERVRSPSRGTRGYGLRTP